MTKPLVFNYGHYEKLRDYANDLLLDNEKLMEDNRKLRQEVTELKQLNDGYVKIIAKNQETNNKLMASVQKQTGGDLISRADAIDCCEDGLLFEEIIHRIEGLPSADRPTPNYITESANDVVEKNDEVIERPIIEHDREWIIGCIKHDGFIKTDRFDKANQIILDALSADAVQGEWIYDHHNDEHTCSVCGRKALCDDYVGIDWQMEVLSDYCPSCGARMKGEEE